MAVAWSDLEKVNSSLLNPLIQLQSQSQHLIQLLIAECSQSHCPAQHGYTPPMFYEKDLGYEGSSLTLSCCSSPSSPWCRSSCRCSAMVECTFCRVTGPWSYTCTVQPCRASSPGGREGGPLKHNTWLTSQFPDPSSKEVE